MPTSAADSLRRDTVGLWLHRYRKWGVLPLIAIGLVAQTGHLPASRGRFMMIAGGVGILFGTVLRIVSLTFIGTKDPVLRPASEGLATEGPYAITRNPVYLAEAAIALGIAMMSRLPWLVLATLITEVIVTALVVDWEESVMRRRHGAAFDEYAGQVPRWFSLRRFVHPDSYWKSRRRIKLWWALRAEGPMLLLGLLTILAFLAKADIKALESLF
jgi:protein-S-isoprenylcysteine O-methyltransferase Ste14